MSHFNKTSLIFYGVAIGSVVTLFSVVTAYGENNLKASLAIGGDYELKIDPKPDCPNPKPLVLTIEQSGVYVSAALSPKDSDTTASEDFPRLFPLSGEWNQQQLKLAGKVSDLEICHPRAHDPQSPHVLNRHLATTVQINGNLTESELKGNIVLDAMSEMTFTAQH
jgi:hypothetical protein